MYPAGNVNASPSPAIPFFHTKRMTPRRRPSRPPPRPRPPPARPVLSLPHRFMMGQCEGCGSLPLTDFAAPVILPVRRGEGYYYYAGSQPQPEARWGRRVAVRVSGSANPQENGLFYTLGDHLGSTSLVTDANGNKVGEMRYPHSHNRHTGRSSVQHARGAGTPWGETRYPG